MDIHLTAKMRLDDLAIERIRELAPKPGLPVTVAYSGGKDSTVLLDLAKRSGIEFRAAYSFVPVDPPELRAFIRERMAVGEPIEQDYPTTSLVAEVRRQGIMPLRQARFCCKFWKERTRAGVVLTGVRWAESTRRRGRRMFEACRRIGNTWFLHPIIDWLDADVWAYIRERELPYCRLYDEGWKRLGCVLCPNSSDGERQAARWPQIVRVWRKASDVAHGIYAEKAAAKGKAVITADEFWAWWLDRDAKFPGSEERADAEAGQCFLFGDGVTE